MINNLKGFDLNNTEISTFNKFRGHSWYVGLVNNTAIPNNLTLFNYGTHNIENFNVPVLPGFYTFYATGVPGLHYFLFGDNDSQPTFSQLEVVKSLEDTITRVRAKGIIPNSTGDSPEVPNIIKFADHSPYEVYAPSDC